MRLYHAASQHWRRLTRRLPILRRFSLAITLLTLLWLYTLHWGERSVFASSIESCQWPTWEKWPSTATPHHLVFVADPQLVDPHTYPGRPWPLSSLTEAYTDTYMARNYRLINERLDPDSIVFLGDLFDGGREWAPGKARAVRESQQQKEKDKSGGSPKERRSEGHVTGPEPELADEEGANGSHAKRSLKSYKKAMTRPHAQPISKEDHFLDAHGNDLKEFVPGENGRWSRWGQQQWDADFIRFGRIFFDTDQLYPGVQRNYFGAWDVTPDEYNVQNGAEPNFTRQEYALSGGKQRKVIASLPGNHDIGLGQGVQLAIRDRFESRFGEGNRIDVIGNHTFVSVDTPSLSATSQYLREGGETHTEKATELKYIWKATMDFLEDIRAPAGKAVSTALHQYYPDVHPITAFPHTVIDTNDHPETSKKQHDSRPHLPVILLSHIPLFRPRDAECGSLRERGKAIAIQAGYQYQNVITQGLSSTVVNRVSAAGDIAHIFSGDDHDYCDVNHRYNLGTYSTGLKPPGGKDGSVLRSIREITIKSFSWAMGVRRPGFLLVSLWNPVDADGKTIGTPRPTLQTHLCLLPDQLNIFIDYALLLALTLAILLVRALVLALRKKSTTTDFENETQDGVESPIKLVLPRSRPGSSTSTSKSNGYSTPTRKSRQRASSITTSSQNTPANDSLSVQRSYNARTRSVSPAAGVSPSNTLPSLTEHTHEGGLVEKAGYYPPVRWNDPGDIDSDEEKSVGVGDREDDYRGEGTYGGYNHDDSQAKWKVKKRGSPPGLGKRMVWEFGWSVMLVGLPSVVYYAWLLRNG
ncbi:hypothetical protein D0864_05862 [Hortaea werneckii]|uniref:Calcineurin-like phosphoesterase domain-containing protein n=1 Tax=Hortaea werneckii TaxID=91943 RepID=A0A3M7FUP2_HORWE|nr:hypothetical protein KC352_g7797 [Hortaea werneckii]RMY92562.1 hypothetical protein D0864_05862 [Hortaea werneckii]